MLEQYLLIRRKQFQILRKFLEVLKVKERWFSKKMKTKEEPLLKKTEPLYCTQTENAGGFEIPNPNRKKTHLQDWILNLHQRESGVGPFPQQLYGG
ncbi:hypothetical protein MIMGU_mgv1a017051mg [Erythranthe guttata]|uniref:Uncharacterized protein n=1 Tax=Erythranthe guttata TaxID=4155 RepID=A0A022Q1U6_ERYGU|nr:hypothetical protein MIMGU_mgv1a017051mg [Erythranthe guttata]